ncbi:MAG: glycosyltransferase family 2 protein [Acidobacteriota bacterium]
MARVAIVVVTYNSAAEIGGCLDALKAVPDVEILVVDNASADATCDEVKRRGVRLIANETNRGFAGAVNQGVGASSAPLVLLLNPDAHLERGLEALAGQFSDPETGASGGLLTGPDGQPQVGFMARNLPTPAALILEVLGINRLWPRNPVNWHYRCLGNSSTTPFPAEQPAGAFLMFSRAAFENVGGFDERFWPVWFEDVDFCAKLKLAGYRVFYNPGARAKHTGGHSVGALPVEIRELYWYGSLLEYGAKHYRPLTFRVLCVAVFSGAVGRAVQAFPRAGRASGGAKAFAVYGAVVRLAAGRMFRPRQGNCTTVF